ncbi:unnamed protein product [Closterium sp. Naga37s-1]|nr:unnamed protein product [Closterium sp. Naga37s-1]
MSASGRGVRGDLEAGPEPGTNSGLASGFSSTAGWSVPSAVDMRWRAPGGQSSGSSNGAFTGTSGLSIQSGGAPPSTQSGFPFSQPQSVGLSGSGGQGSVAARELIVNVQPLVFILTLMFLLMLLSFPQASEFLLWVFIGAFVAAMLRGLSLYRHLADQARAQRAFARLLGLPPSSTSFLLSNPSALASPFPPFGPPFSSLPFQPARDAAVPLSDLPSFPSLSPFPAFPSSLSPSISPSSSSGNLSQSTSAAAARSASASAPAGAESAASASAAQRMHMQQPQAQALSELGGEWFGVGERGGRMEDGSLLAARIGSLVRAQFGQLGASRQQQPGQQLQQQRQQQSGQQQQGQQEEGGRMWLEHQAQLRRLQRHLGLQLALMHRELQASDYDLLRALDADNAPSVPALSDVEIARLPAFPYKPKRSRSVATTPSQLPDLQAPASAVMSVSEGMTTAQCGQQQDKRVLALAEAPFLMDNPETAKLFPADAIARAKKYLSFTTGGIGAYSDSRGLAGIRKEVAEFIAKRDGFPSDPDKIYLTDGASKGVERMLNVLIRNEKDGILCPIPQYPLYSASIALLGGTLVPYYLDESQGWGLDMAELKQSCEDARSKGIEVRCLVFINPGNPTGNCLSEENLKELVKFCVDERLVLLADEVYQENVYQDERPFLSAKKVAMSMGEPYASSLELVSFHTVSKGTFGECGQRGGYMEIFNIDEGVCQELYKMSSISLCPNLCGQLMVGLMVNPPAPGDASYEEFTEERSSRLASLRRRAHTVTEGFNSCKNITCNFTEGAMYSFPRINLPEKALEAAKAAGKAADVFYCLRLLEATGITAVPGTGFGQKEG